ncbi:hypothetical protein [Polymorphobacter megasporae]|uniref:hypothetical protein n=1 Tax=Glacieibacterium megasporae TaxID=2835787 RepID=UPI001C1E7758|nr:hypothetical protein [Polymorphobacter megasporae]UAJ10254.1 hypothetical protein KTC28_00290 [Polymorphobacter megasporae]
MNRVRSLLRAQAWLTLVVALIALGVQILVPPGFMPVRDGGRTVFTICTGHGAVSVAAPGHAPKPEGKSEAPCGFSGIAVAIDAAAPPLVVAPPVQVVAVEPIDFVTLPILRVHRLRPPPRGPPALRSA